MDGNELSESVGSNSASRWRLRTRVLIAGGALVAVLGSAAGIDVATRDRDHESHVFESGVSSLDARISSGSLEVIGTDDPNITIEVTTRGGLRGPKHSERVVGDQLELRSSCPLHLLTPSCSVDYVVRLPRNLDIVAHGNGSNITITSVAGSVDASSNGGALDLRFAEAPYFVRGRSNGGRVAVELPRGDEFYRVDADSNGGKAKVEVRTDPASERQIDLHANGGQVEVRYAEARS